MLSRFLCVLVCDTISLSNFIMIIVSERVDYSARIVVRLDQVYQFFPRGKIFRFLQSAFLVTLLCEMSSEILLGLSSHSTQSLTTFFQLSFMTTTTINPVSALAPGQGLVC